MSTAISYDVKIESRCLYEEHEEAEYGSWCSEWSNEFQYIKRYGENEIKHQVFHSDLKLKPGAEVFLVWAEYSTGDSFGNASRGSVEIIEIFSSKEEAKDIVDRLYRHTEYSFTGETLSGRPVSLYCPWHGYFEHLDDIHIEHAIVQ
jgi:hypothetical protein